MIFSVVVLFPEKQVAGDKGRQQEDSGGMPESEGSAQLGTAGLLSV